MKNYAFLVIVMLMFSACAEAPEKKPLEAPSKSEFEVELAKKFTAIKIIKIIGEKAVDAFGNPLQENRWYELSNQTKSVFPVAWLHGSTMFHFDSRHKLFYPNIQMKREMRRIVITNGNALGAAVDAELLVLGEHHICLLPKMSAHNPYAVIHITIR